MKKIFLVCVLAAPSFNSFSQCNVYFPLQQGMSWTYESYNASDKLTGKNEMTVKEFNSTDNGYEAIVSSVIYDNKGKKISSGELTYTCENGTVFVDMRKFVPEQQLSAMGSYEMEITSDNLEIPSDLKEGQSLKDGTITLTASNAPIPMSIEVRITDRVVKAKEDITVPAGDFGCYKIISSSKMNMKMGMSINNEYRSVQWYAENVGMVRSESYDQNGKLTGYSVLVKK